MRPCLNCACWTEALFSAGRRLAGMLPDRKTRGLPRSRCMRGCASRFFDIYYIIMSPPKKNTDGIRRSASSGPVRLSPQSDASERVQDAPRGLDESETELHWEKEGTPEKLYEMRTPLPEKEEYIEAPIIHKPFPARRSRSWGINDRRSFIGAYSGGIAIAAIFVLVSTVLD